MRRTNRILIGAGCAALLIVAWIVVVSSKSPVEKQLELMHRAAEMTNDGIYILAVPLLEEAAGYTTVYTPAAEAELKKVYLALIDQSGFRRRYTGLLDKQMNRRGARPDVFAEAAGYYLSISRVPEALSALKAGIVRTGSEELAAMYESSRYAYEMSRTTYDYVAEIYETTVQVQSDGLWGLAKSDGILVIPCEYEKISTYSEDRAVVRKNGEVYAVDIDNNRVAVLREYAADFGNFSEARVTLLIDGRWVRATEDLVAGAVMFEQLGMYSGGHAAAKANGKWGVIDMAANWLIPPEYDAIIQDELGRCYARGAVFARKDGVVRLFTGGRMTEEWYEDARPFSDEGFAAVKRDGKWGFIDIDGNPAVDYLFDDALSFGQHLAAVKLGEFWGYISMRGEVVIEPVFIEAKSFSNGSAPVLTERGWQFITLLEYKRGAGL